jgi:hypothetical protein
MSLVYGPPDAMPRYLGQMGGGEPGHRSVRVTVAEALRARFPLRNEPGAQPRTTSVAEALRSRFPATARTASTARTTSVPRTASTARTASGPGTAFAETARPTLPRRIRNMSVSARPAEPSANPELLLRILDGLQRL